MCTKRKYLPLVLFVLVLLPVLILTGLQARQYLLQHSAAERLSGNHTQTIVVAESEIIWEEQGRELIIDGRYFDVTRLERSGSNLLLTGHYDDAETLLAATLQKALGQVFGKNFSRILLLLQCLLPMVLIRFLLQPPVQGSSRAFYLPLPLPLAYTLPPYQPPR